MDDIAAGVHLYRTAKAASATVIDAYMSPLPSVKETWRRSRFTPASCLPVLILAGKQAAMRR